MKRTLAIALLLAACSNEPAPPTTTAAEKATTPPAPNAQQARQLIEASPALSEHEFTNAAVSIAVSGAVMSEPVRQQAKQLAAAGWIDFDGAGDIMLNDKSRSDKRFLLRENGILDVVPLARKQMGEVSAVRPNEDGTVGVDFTWRWIPNEVGTAFTSGIVHDRFAATQNAIATLMWDGTNWTVLKIDAR
ncbi:MAG TPA: hypothetical protein VGF28_09625 [Thermoanaerobaculia bacterium]|jgi:hypothetical protein